MSIIWHENIFLFLMTTVTTQTRHWNYLKVLDLNFDRLHECTYIFFHIGTTMYPFVQLIHKNVPM